MKIKKIHIDCFGKFEDYDLELSDGLNVIYGQNEDGKSTLMAFILMMFYGYSGKSRDLLKNPRDKYRPWNGKEMKGYVLFEHKGLLYRLERTFGKSNSSDKVSILDEITGETIKGASQKDPGQEFFGLGEEAFAKSVFIGQGGILVDASGKKDEITEKLLNLVTTGSEDVSYKKAVDTLSTAMESLESKSGRLGSLVKAKEKVQELKELRRTAEIDELDKKYELSKIEDLRKKLLEEETQYRSFKEQLRVLDYHGEKEKLEEALSREEKLAQAEEALAASKEKLKTSEGDLTEEKVEEISEMLRAQESLSFSLKAEEERRDKLSEQLQAFQKEPVLSVEEEVLVLLRNKEEALEQQKEERTSLLGQLDQVKKREDLWEKRQHTERDHSQAKAEFDQLKASADIKKQEFQEKAEELSTLRDQRETLLEEIKKLQISLGVQEEKVRNSRDREASERSEGNHRIEEARERLQDARKPKEFLEEVPSGKTVHKGLLGSAVLLTLLSLLAGILWEPYYLGGLLLALILGILSVRKTQATTRTIQKTDEALVRKREEELQSVQRETEEKIHRATTLLSDALQEKDRQENLLTEKERTFTDITATWKQRKEAADLLEVEVNADKMELTRKEMSVSSLMKDLEELEELWIAAEGPKEYPSRETLETRLAEIGKSEESLRSEIKELLTAYGAADYEALLTLHHQFRTHLDKVAEKKATLLTQEELCSTLREKETQGMENLLKRVSTYKEASDLLQATFLLKEMEEALEDYKEKLNYAAYLREGRKALEMSKSREEIQNERNVLQEAIRVLLGKEEYGQEDLDTLKREKERSEDLEKTVTTLKEEIVRLESELKEKYKHKKNLSQIDDELDFYKDKVEKRQQTYDALKLARTQLENAFSELQRSFGPKVNEKTEKIFEKLTDGKYQKVRVARDFSISVEDPERKSSYAWGFLSGGTIDQAYLSLRLAISDLVMNEEENLPIFLDDVFTQYDDERAYAGLQFLEDYAKKKEDPIQTVLFTCHRRLFDWASDMGEVHTSILTKTAQD